MRKSYLMMAAAATLFAACTQADFVNEVPETKQAIGFENFVAKSTRHMAGTNMEKFHTNFGVFGYNDVDDLFMDNYKTEHTASVWNYGGVTGGANGTTVQTLKYWNKNTSYDFYAYAPYNAGVKRDGGVLTIPSGDYAAIQNLQTEFSTTLNESAFSTDTDWMLAAPKTDVTYTSVTEGTVPFVFSHMLSKLVVAVQTTGDETVEITNLKIEGGTYKTGSYNGTDGWTASNEVTLEGKIGNITTKNTDYYSMEYLLIPVANAAPKLDITYKVNGQTYTLTDLAIDNLNAFAAGTYYTLTVSVGLQPIKFTATSAEWATDVNGGVTIE